MLRVMIKGMLFRKSLPFTESESLLPCDMLSSDSAVAKNCSLLECCMVLLDKQILKLQRYYDPSKC
jgi:hypothetical protein